MEFPGEARDRDPDFVRSLAAGLSVIRTFGAQNPLQTLSEVARKSGLSRAAARRHLITLSALGYVTSDGKYFSLRPRVLELGYAYLSSLSFAEVAAPHIERLVEQTHESSSVAVLDGSDIVYVARVPTRRIMTVAISIGTRFPAYATSMGRVLLGGLSSAELSTYLAKVEMTPLTRQTISTKEALLEAIEETRRVGYSIVDQELEDGLRSIAAPIFDINHAVTAAINVSAHAARVSLEELRGRYADHLLQAAHEISSDLVTRQITARTPR